MSFILDALRKSDAERQRTATPGIADARFVRRKIPRNTWLPVLVVILAANLVVMSVQWLRRPEPAAAPVDSRADAGANANASEWVVPVSPPAPSPPGQVRPLAREVESGSAPEELMARRDVPEAPVIAEAPTGSAARTPAPEPAAAPAPQPGTPRGETLAGSPADAGARIGTGADTPAAAPTQLSGLPSADQLVAAGQLGTAPLNLDLHVYSGNVADRFVVINSRRYGEGARLAEGPTIETITADGVILANAGTRFLLQRK